MLLRRITMVKIEHGGMCFPAPLARLPISILPHDAQALVAHSILSLNMRATAA